jgi:hypothetical protein
MYVFDDAKDNKDPGWSHWAANRATRSQTAEAILQDIHHEADMNTASLGDAGFILPNLQCCPDQDAISWLGKDPCCFGMVRQDRQADCIKHHCEACPQCCCIVCLPFCRIGLFAQGYWADMKLYVYNNHPVLSIFFASRENRLSLVERAILEFATFQITFMSAYLLKAKFMEPNGMYPDAPMFPGAHIWDVDLPEGNWYQFGFMALTTATSLLVWDLLFYLFAAPCLIGMNCGTLAHCASEIFGYVVAFGLSFLAFYFVWYDGLQGKDGKENDIFQEVFHQTLVTRYLISLIPVYFGALFCRRFNPFIAWGEPNLESYKAAHEGYLAKFKERGICAALSCLLKIGYWRIQKQQFQTSCVKMRKVERERLKAATPMLGSHLHGAVHKQNASCSLQ